MDAEAFSDCARMHCQKSPGRSEQHRETRAMRAARKLGHVSLGTFFAPKKVPRPPVREPAMVVAEIDIYIIAALAVRLHQNRLKQ